jgi:hypothetical protein
MAQDSPPRSEASVATLIGGIVNDAKDLLINEFTIAKLEIQQEMRKTKSAALAFAMGAGVIGIGGFFLLMMCVHGLVVLLDIPIWGSYGLVGGLLFLVGVILLVRGKHRAEQIEMIPPKTASTLRDNAQWIKEQTTSNRV